MYNIIHLLEQLEVVAFDLFTTLFYSSNLGKLGFY